MLESASKCYRARELGLAKGRELVSRVRIDRRMGTDDWHAKSVVRRTGELDQRTARVVGLIFHFHEESLDPSG